MGRNLQKQIGDVLALTPEECGAFQGQINKTKATGGNLTPRRRCVLLFGPAASLDPSQIISRCLPAVLELPGTLQIVPCLRKKIRTPGEEPGLLSPGSSPGVLSGSVFNRSSSAVFLC